MMDPFFMGNTAPDPLKGWGDTPQIIMHAMLTTFVGHVVLAWMGIVILWVGIRVIMDKRASARFVDANLGRRFEEANEADDPASFLAQSYDAFELRLMLNRCKIGQKRAIAQRTNTVSRVTATPSATEWQGRLETIQHAYAMRDTAEQTSLDISLSRNAGAK